MSGGGGGSRRAVAIDERDQARIARGLGSWAETGEFIALRTRAFVYLLWDGGIRTKAAVHLDIEEVVGDPDSRRIHVVTEVRQRPCAGNAYQGKKFLLSKRTRDAIAALLRAEREWGWLPTEAGRFEGPLFLSARRGKGNTRMSQRTAVQSWHTFQHERVQLSREYQLDDVVLTGRLAFLEAADGDASLLSEQANLSPKRAADYRSLMEQPSSTSGRDVLARLERRRS